MSAPIVESPRVPEIERCDLEKWAAQVNEEILDVCADVQEGGSGRSLPVLTARQALLESLASGRLRTYSPESDGIFVPREVLKSLDADLSLEGAYSAETAYTPATDDGEPQTWQDVVRGWLVSTKQEVSE